MKKHQLIRMTALVLSFVISISLTACSKGGTQNSENALPSNSAQTTEKTDTAWPERDITAIIPAAAGGGSDTLARLIIPFLEEEWGVKIIIENYDTSIDGTVALSEAKSDGYTMSLAQNTDYGLHVVCYDLGVTLDDFCFTGGITTTPMILAASEGSGIQTLDDLITRAQAEPEKVVCTISGATHLLESLMMEDVLGIDITTVTRSSGGESAQALMGSNNEIGILAAKFGPQIEEYGGTILGIFTGERVENFPEYATFSEQGFDLTDDVMRGWAFPDGTDPAIIAKVESTMEKLCGQEDFIRALAEGGEIVSFKNSADYTVALNDYLEIAQEAYQLYPDAF